MAVDMLWDDAGAARDILKAWKPRMTKEEYLTFQRGIARTELYDGASSLIPSPLGERAG